MPVIREQEMAGKNLILLCYFNVSTVLVPQLERAYSVCGTIEYMAPEIAAGGEAGHDMVNYYLERVLLPVLLFLTQMHMVHR
jgi:hypothetical protein